MKKLILFGFFIFFVNSTAVAQEVSISAEQSISYAKAARMFLRKIITTGRYNNMQLDIGFSDNAVSKSAFISREIEGVGYFISIEYTPSSQDTVINRFSVSLTRDNGVALSGAVDKIVYRGNNTLQYYGTTNSIDLNASIQLQSSLITKKFTSVIDTLDKKVINF